MLTSLEAALKAWLLPGTTPFLVTAVAVGVGLLYAGDTARRWGRRWLTLVAIVYWALASPLCSDILVSSLSRAGWLQAGSIPQVAAIVVLSNGADVYQARGEALAAAKAESVYNALEGARLYRLATPRWIVASGGIVDPMQRTPEAALVRAALEQLGVPPDRIVDEDQSRNTRQQAVDVGALLRQRGVSRFILVTTPQHMPRALGAFHEVGLDPVPSASAYRSTQPLHARTMLLPSAAALENSRWAVYEFLGRGYYWARGWWTATGQAPNAAPAT